MMLAAMIRGGSDDQKSWAIDLAVHTVTDAEREAKRQRAVAIYPDGDADRALRCLLPGLSEVLGVHRKNSGSGCTTSVLQCPKHFGLKPAEIKDFWHARFESSPSRRRP